MKPIVQISNLDKYFGRLHVLKNISLDVQPREVVCLIGEIGGPQEAEAGQYIRDHFKK